MIPGAYLARNRFCCGPGCQTVACHPARPDWPELVSHDRTTVSDWWSGRPYSVLLTTGRAFDVLEVSAFLGVSTADASRRGPVARSSTGRWLLLTRPGSALLPELAGRTDVVLHGAGSWIPAPPTRSPQGRMRWVVTPAEVRWRLPDPEAVQRMVAEALPEPGRHRAAPPADGTRLRYAV